MAHASLSSHSPSLADVFRRAETSTLLQVTGIVAFALLAAAGAQFRVYLWEVPITFQTLAVYGAGLFLGSRNGALSMLAYLGLGLFFPVFAGDGFGWAYLTSSASAGYLLSYPLVALLVGRLTERWTSLAGSALAMALGMMLVFTSGVIWLHYAAGHATWWTSIYKGAVLFLIWEALKVAAMSTVHNGLSRLSVRD